MLLVVNYHYVGANSSLQNVLFPVSEYMLQKQLAGLKRLFTFVSEADIIAHIEKKRELPPLSCLVTFDDGLRCQFESALPVLEKMKIPALFFVSSLPYGYQQPLHIHKVQLLRSKYSSKKLLALFAESYQKLTKHDFSLSDFVPSIELLKEEYKYDSLEQARLKYLLSKGKFEYPGLREEIIDNLFRREESNLLDFLSRFYMSKRQIRTLAQMGYLGFHSNGHRSFKEMTPEEIKEDLQTGCAIVKQITGGFHTKSISYPYGHIRKEVLPSIASLGFQIGFTLERAFNKMIEKEPLLLGRFDTNDVPGGKQPLFALEGEEVLLSSLLSCRRLFFFE